MGYEQALEKAWAEISGLAPEKQLSLKFLNDNYSINTEARSVLSESCNVPAKTYLSILLLHYLIRKFRPKGPVKPTGEWIDFNQLEGGEEYYPTFKKRTISHLLRKYGKAPEAILKVSERLPVKTADKGDVGIVVYPFVDVPILITMWKADDEFGPDANILFDRTIADVFCTEDIVVLTETIVHSL